MRILIAEDDNDIVEILQAFLESKGHRVDIASNGEKAHDMLKLHKYDLAFIDYNMPELTGLELVEFIKKSHLNTKTVVVTGYPDIKEFFAKAVGADEYFEKPFKLEQIGKIVTKYSQKNTELPSSD